MAKNETKGETRINIALPTIGYKRRMVFNRFALQRIDLHVFISFGLVDDSGMLRDHYACVLSKQSVEDAKASLTTFLARIGLPDGTNIKWTPPSGVMEIDMGNIINMGLSTDAEILINAFAMSPAAAKSKQSDKPIEVEGVAMLRCSPELMKLLIVELYDN
jgi:hypothetical protein